MRLISHTFCACVPPPEILDSLRSSSIVAEDGGEGFGHSVLIRRCHDSDAAVLRFAVNTACLDGPI